MEYSLMEKTDTLEFVIKGSFSFKDEKNFFPIVRKIHETDPGKADSNAEQGQCQNQGKSSFDFLKNPEDICFHVRSYQNKRS